MEVQKIDSYKCLRNSTITLSNKKVLMMPISGKDFKRHHPDTQFCKLTIDSECHGNVLLQTGTNVDDIRFDSDGVRKPGKIIFIDIAYIGTFLAEYGQYACDYIEYGKCTIDDTGYKYYLLPSLYNQYRWIRRVTIDDDAIIYSQDDIYRATKLTLSEREDIWSNEELCKIIVTSCGLALEFVHQQTDEICKLAVKQNGLALEFVDDQTDEICLLAVKQNGLALEFVGDQTDEICLAAVKQNGWALKYVDDQTEEICLAAVKQNGLVLEFVDDQTEEICLAAVKQNGLALMFVDDQTEEMCEISVMQNGSNLVHVKRQTYKICKLAVQKCYTASQYVSTYYKIISLFTL